MHVYCIHFRPEPFPKRRIASGATVSSSPPSSQLGGLIGRGKGAFTEDVHHVASFSQSRPIRSRQNSDISPEEVEVSTPTTPVNTVSAECLAKPVVFLEYGDL